MIRLAKHISTVLIACLVFTSVPMIGAVTGIDDSYNASAATVVSVSEKVIISESGLRMRASYSTSSAIKGTVTKGKVYQLKAKTSDGKWGQLSSNGYWIYLSYTTPVQESSSDSNIVASSEIVKVTESGLRMRASYSTSSAIMGKVTKGNTYQLKAKSKDGKWGQLATNGYWIYLSYTTPVQATTAEPSTPAAPSEPAAPSTPSTGTTDNNIVTCSEKVKVTESGLRMRASYSTSSAIMGKVTKGNTYQLQAKTKDGKWGQLATNGYWIYLSYTTPVASASTTPSTPSTNESNIVTTSEYVKVIASGLRMRASHSTSSAIKGTATKNKAYKLQAKTKDGKWGQLATNGYWIYLSYTNPHNPTASEIVNDGGVAKGVCTGEDIVNYAKQFLGNPYVYGGTSLTNGTDCSGYTMGVYGHFGISLPRTSAMQATVGKAVSYNEAKAGDIFYYIGHVAIYMGNGKIIHASNAKDGIKISNALYRDPITIRRIIE